MKRHNEVTRTAEHVRHGDTKGATKMTIELCRDGEGEALAQLAGGPLRQSCVPLVTSDT